MPKKKRIDLPCCLVVLTICAATAAYGQEATSQAQSEPQKQVQQKQGSGITSQPQIQQQLSTSPSQKTLKSINANPCTSRRPCYTPRSDAEVLRTQMQLAPLLTQFLQTYGKYTSEIRDEVDAPAPDDLKRWELLATPRRAGGKRQTNLRRASYSQAPANSFAEPLGRIAINCRFLATGLTSIGLSGLADYVQQVVNAVESDRSTGDIPAARHAVKSTDAMYSKLLNTRANISVAPEITSLPTGAELLIATKLQASQGRAEFSGSTDTKGRNIYRGIYRYTISAPGFETFNAELDLINSPGDRIVCKKHQNVNSLYCEPQ